MSRQWPSALKPYVGPTPNAVTFKPAHWASGQLTWFVGSCVAVVAGLIAVVMDADHRLAGVAFIAVFTVFAWISGRERKKWVRVEISDNAIDVISGVWRRTTRRQPIGFIDVQSVRVQDDQKTYGYKIPVRRHVAIDYVASPFSGAPAEIRIGEMFCLDQAVLEALRDELAARATKTPVTSIG